MILLWWLSGKSFSPAILGQIPGAEQAIESAAAHGYEAVVIVMVIIAMITGFVLLFKAQARRDEAREKRESEREARLAGRVTTLETKLEEKLMGLVESSVSALTANTEVLKHTNEMLDSLKQAVVQSHDDQQRLLTRLENSPCIATGLMSDETKDIFSKLGREARDRERQGGA